jgi:tetratricopeptide (TPR) repeat protein
MVHYSRAYLSRVERGERLASPALARACDEALEADGALARLVSVERPARRSTVHQRPAQLPATVGGFSGRAWAVAELEAAISGGAGTVVISAIGGMAGVGKTALAVHFAHRVAARFPDGQLYVNLRGFDQAGPPLAPAAAIRGFLEALNVPSARIPPDLEAQAGLYRSLLAGRRMLILADNARDPSQIRPLLPGAAGCLVLVTSRNQLTGLAATDGARLIGLDVLTETEARDLLVARLGHDRVAAEPDAVAELIGLCGRLPLALAIAAALAAARPASALSVLAAELRGRRLDVLATGDDPAADVRAVFSWSYRALAPTAARLFRLLGLHPGPDFTVAAVASLAGVPARSAHQALAALADMNLLTEPIPGRFAFHDLVRGYAAELARATDPEPARHAAVGRMLDHYLRTADAASILLVPKPLPSSVALPPLHRGVTPEQLAGAAGAQAWFSAERLVLLAVIGQAASSGWNSHAAQLAWALRDYLSRGGYYHELMTSHGTALEACRSQGDRRGEARSHSGIASAYGWLGLHREASAHLLRALDLFAELGDAVRQATTHLDLGWVLSNEGRIADALGHAEQALDLYRAAGDQHGQAGSLNSIGWSHALLGDYQRAVTSCQQALALQREIGDQRHEGATLDSLGYAYDRLGQRDRAIDCYQQAVTLHHEYGDRYYEAVTLDHLGDAHHAAGDQTAARAAWQQAADLLDDLDRPAAQVLAKLTTANHVDSS